MSYAVSCHQFAPDGYAIVEHGTDDRRPVSRDGVPPGVRAMCGAATLRSYANPFMAERTESSVFSAELSVCIECARKEQGYQDARASVVADGIPLAYGKKSL